MKCGLTKSLRLKILPLAVATLVLGHEAALADDPEQFYKNDYAARPDVRGSSPDIWKYDKKETPAAVAPQTNATTTESTAPKNSKKKRSILVFVYVNSLDREHFSKVIKEVLRLHDERQASVFGVYHAGLYTSVTSEIGAELATRNIEITQVDGPPEALQSTHSPTWVVKTKEGVHIVEGELSLQAHLDEYGIFNPKGTSEHASESKGF